MSNQSVGQLQLLEQNLQQIFSQKHALQEELSEIESALKDVNSSTQSYKIVGKLMILQSKDEITANLNKRKEMLTLKLSSFDKQEKVIGEKISKTQTEMLKEFEQKKPENN